MLYPAQMHPASLMVWSLLFCFSPADFCSFLRGHLRRCLLWEVSPESPSVKLIQNSNPLLPTIPYFSDTASITFSGDGLFNSWLFHQKRSTVMSGSMRESFIISLLLSSTIWMCIMCWTNYHSIFGWTNEYGNDPTLWCLLPDISASKTRLQSPNKKIPHHQN